MPVHGDPAPIDPWRKPYGWKMLAPQCHHQAVVPDERVGLRRGASDGPRGPAICGRPKVKLADLLLCPEHDAETLAIANRNR